MPDAGRSAEADVRALLGDGDGFDGGNVKVSINGGAFTVVPASAYIFNKPTTLLTAAAGNTNPLAGQPGFTGTDGGEIKGSWGESQVDLTRLGVKPGDTIQFRFDFGRDGCGGIDGWYVDDVQVVDCKPAARPWRCTVQSRPPSAPPDRRGHREPRRFRRRRPGGHRDGERRQGHGAGLGHPRGRQGLGPAAG